MHGVVSAGIEQWSSFTSSLLLTRTQPVRSELFPLIRPFPLQIYPPGALSVRFCLHPCSNFHTFGT